MCIMTWIALFWKCYAQSIYWDAIIILIMYAAWFYL